MVDNTASIVAIPFSADTQNLECLTLQGFLKIQNVKKLYLNMRMMFSHIIHHTKVMISDLGLQDL